MSAIVPGVFASERGAEISRPLYPAGIRGRDAEDVNIAAVVAAAGKDVADDAEPPRVGGRGRADDDGLAVGEAEALGRGAGDGRDDLLAVDVDGDGNTTQSVFAGNYTVKAKVTQGTPIITVKPNSASAEEGAGAGVRNESARRDADQPVTNGGKE